MPQDEYKVSNHRLSMIMVLTMMAALIIMGRLYQKQVIEYPQYRVLAQRQHLSRNEISAERGKIYASEEYSDSFPLATNLRTYQLLVIPRAIKDYQLTAQELAKKINMAEKEILVKINNKKVYIPPLQKRIEKDRAKAIMALDLPGILLVPESVRYYPEGEMAGQVLGYVDTEGKGRYGVEGMKDSIMQGKTGIALTETDRRGVNLSSDERAREAQNGDDLVLTIEHNVQFKAEEILEAAIKKYQAKSGSIIIIDIPSGGITAMASKPSYDPNKYNKIAAKHGMSIFNNPAVCAAWEPGSVLKPLVMAAALDRRAVSPNTTGVYKSHVTVQGSNIWTAQKLAYGRETMSQVLQNSDNVAMVWIAKKLGSEWLYRYLTALGFGEPTQVELQGEASGNLPRLEDWMDINRATISFGQGISMTPLQLATAYGAIANGGVLFKPHIIAQINSNQQKIINNKENIRRVYSAKTAKEITKMLVSVVELGHGKKAAVEGYKIAGKTGTAQVPKPRGGYYQDRHIGSFGGFFPANSPRFVMVVKIDYPKKTKWAEASAAPTFGEMAEWLLKYYRIRPDSSR